MRGRQLCKLWMLVGTLLSESRKVQTCAEATSPPFYYMQLYK